MLKNLSVAAILLAAALANASEVTNKTSDEVKQFDTPTIKNIKKNSPVAVASHKHKKESSSSDSSSDSDSGSTSTSSSSSGSSSSSRSSKSSSNSDSDSSSDSSSSSSSSSTDSDSDSSSVEKNGKSDSEKKTKSGKKAVKAFKKSHGKKWLKDHKEHDVTLKRQKVKVDSKGKKLKHSKKSKYSIVKNALKIKSKKPVMITVNDNNIKKGLTVNDNGDKLFKTPKKSYAIVDKGTHNFTIKANKKGKKGTATVKVQEVKLSKRIAKKYKIIANAVKYKDAQELCERFGGTLAEVRKKDVNKILDAAKKLMEKNNVDSLWIDRVIQEEDKNTYVPTVLNLENGQGVDEKNYAHIAEFAKEQIAAIKPKKSDTNYKKALAKAEAKIRKFTDKQLDKQDKSAPRPVLCRFD